jgi:uncharacterized phage protein (TIGR01671 family)
MRKIAFRAWDEFNKKWLPEEILCVGFDGTLQQKGVAGTIGGCIISQYTGMKDYKGKEIYEGDILGIATEEIVGEPRSWAVKWTTTDYNAFFNFGDMPRMDLYCEVIGNIYENPDWNVEIKN